MSKELFRAAHQGDYGKVQALTGGGVDINAQDRYGRSALHWAVKGNHSGICLQLLHQGINPALADDKKRTALHYCAGYGYMRPAWSLLRAGGPRLDVNARDYRGQTALHICARTLKERDVYKPISAFKPDLFLRDDEGLTAAELAEREGNKQVAGALRAFEKLELQRARSQGLSVSAPAPALSLKPHGRGVQPNGFPRPEPPVETVSADEVEISLPSLEPEAPEPAERPPPKAKSTSSKSPQQAPEDEEQLSMF